MELTSVEQRILAGDRLSGDEALHLYRHAPTYWLGRMADAVRARKHPANVVTYIIDRNVNYTNVCITDCQFCAFYRPSETHPEAYTLSREAIAGKMDELIEAGGTRALMQGGHNPRLPLAWYEDLLRWMRATWPEIELDCFSPSEIDHIAHVEGCSMTDVLVRLQAAGIAARRVGDEVFVTDEGEMAQGDEILGRFDALVKMRESIEDEFFQADEIRVLVAMPRPEGLPELEEDLRSNDDACESGAEERGLGRIAERYAGELLK